MSRVPAILLVVVPVCLLVSPGASRAEEDVGRELVGTWDSGGPGPRVRYEIKPDGTYLHVTADGEETTRNTGTWRRDGDDVVLVLGDTELAFKTHWVDGDHVDFWLAEEDEDEDAVVRRWVRRRADAEPPPPLEGTWELVEEDLRWSLRLEPDGRYAWHRETRGDVNGDEGTWRLVASTLLLMQDGDRKKLLGFNLRRLSPDELELTLGVRSGLPKVYRRAGERKETPPAIPADLLGEWAVKGEAMSVYLRITEDGRFHHELKTPVGKEVTAGTLTVEGDKLVAKPENEPVTYVLTWKLHGKNRLELFDPSENETTILRRKGTENESPWEKLDPAVRELAGTWLARSDEVELKLVMTAEGGFEQSLRTKEGTTVTKGLFNVEGNDLLIVVEGESEIQRMGFRREGKTLSLIEEGRVVAELVRQSPY